MSKDIEALGLAPLHVIKDNLDRLFGVNAWIGWEHETITEATRTLFSELARDKISVLQALFQDQSLFDSSILFFLHATDVINNKVADMEFLPMPTSLELAYSIYSFKTLLGSLYVAPSPQSDLVDGLVYLLIEEGFSEPIEPFGFIPKERFTAGQTKDDTAAKQLAINSYIKHMESL